MEMLFFLLRQTFNFAIPLMIVALAGLVSEKGGVVNIGLEGMMVIGAFCSVIFINKTSGILSGQLQLVLAMFIAMAGGMIVSVIHAFASITLRANQIISGIAINTFAPSFAVFVARIILGQSIIPFSNTFLIEQVPVLTDGEKVGGSKRAQQSRRPVGRPAKHMRKKLLCSCAVWLLGLLQSVDQPN